MNYRSVLSAVVQTVGLFVSAFIIPFVGQVVALFTPVPLMVAYAKRGRAEGLAALGLSSAVVALVGGWQAAAILFFSFGLMALGSAEGMRRRMKPEHIALLGGLIPVVALGLFLAVYFVRAGKNPDSLVEEYLRGSLAEAAHFYAGMGLNEMAATVTSVSDSFVRYFVRLLPGLVITTSVVQAACCYGLARAIILRRPEGAAALPPASFADWHAPDQWVWGLIVSLALVMAPGETLRFSGANLAILCAAAYLAQGSAIVDHYLKRTRAGAIVRGLIIILILAMPSIVFVIALGVVDVWADFRKVRGPYLKT